MIFSLIKFVIPIVLLVFGVLQTCHYVKIRKYFEQLPIVASEIVSSKLHDNPWSDTGRREYEAQIKFKYRFRGKEYIADTPALRGYRLWPDYSYEWFLLDKYKPGEIVNARVIPGYPELAYLEVAPLHKLSAVLMPFVSLGYLAFMSGYFYFVGEFFF